MKQAMPIVSPAMLIKLKPLCLIRFRIAIFKKFLIITISSQIFNPIEANIMPNILEEDEVARRKDLLDLLNKSEGIYKLYMINVSINDN